MPTCPTPAQLSSTTTGGEFVVAPEVVHAYTSERCWALASAIHSHTDAAVVALRDTGTGQWVHLGWSIQPGFFTDITGTVSFSDACDRYGPYATSGEVVADVASCDVFIEHVPTGEHRFADHAHVLAHQLTGLSTTVQHCTAQCEHAPR